MRKIIATEFYTLDGMMSDPKDEMDWVLNTFNAEMGKYSCVLGNGKPLFKGIKQRQNLKLIGIE